MFALKNGTFSKNVDVFTDSKWLLIMFLQTHALTYPVFTRQRSPCVCYNVQLFKNLIFYTVGRKYKDTTLFFFYL